MLLRSFVCFNNTVSIVCLWGRGRYCHLISQGSKSPTGQKWYEIPSFWNSLASWAEFVHCHRWSGESFPGIQEYSCCFVFAVELGLVG